MHSLTTSSRRPSVDLRQRAAVALTAILVGIVASVCTIAFREGFAALQSLLFGRPLSDGMDVARAAPSWLVLLAPVAGGLVVGLLARYALPSGRVQGISDVIERGDMRPTRLTWRTGAVAALASTAAIGTGASVGREGPMVHLGATVGASIAKRFSLSADAIRQMVACGAAAGVAASFNAPIAGALFAAEVIVGRYTIYAFAPLVIASVSGTIVSRLYFGDLQEFDVPVVGIEAYAEIPSFALLGLACAALALAFIRGTALLDRAWNATKVPQMLRPAIGGLGLGLIAMQWPEVLGVGYESTSAAIAGGFTIGAALVLLAAKLVASSVCLGSGMAGGIFSPVLMIGALLGCAWGGAMALIAPEISSSVSVYALVGMGALAAAALGAPLSTTLIVFEMTGDWQTAIAVMASVSFAVALAGRMVNRSFFLTQLARRGMMVASGPQSWVPAAVPVARVLRRLPRLSPDELDACRRLARAGTLVPDHATLPEALRLLDRAGADFLPVIAGPTGGEGGDAAAEVIGALFQVDAWKAQARALSAYLAETHR